MIESAIGMQRLIVWLQKLNFYLELSPRWAIWTQVFWLGSGQEPHTCSCIPAKGGYENGREEGQKLWNL